MFKSFLVSVPLLFLCCNVLSQTIKSSKSTAVHKQYKPSKEVLLNREKAKTKKPKSEIYEGLFNELKRLKIEVEKHQVDLRLIDKFISLNMIYPFIRAKDLVYIKKNDFINLVNKYDESITEILTYLDELCIAASQK